MKKIIVVLNSLVVLSFYHISIKTQPQPLMNFGNSCYVNSIIQALNATKPLIKVIPKLTFEDNVGKNFKILIQAIKDQVPAQINAALLHFYASIVKFSPPELPTEKQPSIQANLETLNKEIKNLEESIAQVTTLFPEHGTPEEKENWVIQENLKESYSYELQEKMLTKELVKNLNKSPDYIKNLLKKVSELGQEDASQYLSQLITNNLMGDNNNSSTFKTLEEIFFYTIQARNQEVNLMLTIPTIEGLGLSELPFTEVEGKIKITTQIKESKTLKDCLNNYFVDASILLPSPIFLIALNRFIGGYNTNSKVHKTIKLSHRIVIPFNLDMSGYINGGGDIRYDLYAAINHRGTSAYGGHYVAYVKDNDKWFQCNDSIITQISNSKAQEEINKDGYILFYKQTEEFPQEESYETEEKEKLHKEMQEGIRKHAEREKIARDLLAKKMAQKEAEKLSKKKEDEEKANLEEIKRIEEEERQAELQKIKKREEDEKASIAAIERIVQEEELRQKKLEQEEHERKPKEHEKLRKEQEKKERERKLKLEEDKRKALQEKQEQIKKEAQLAEAQRKAKEEQQRLLREKEKLVAKKPIDISSLISKMERLKKALTTLKGFLPATKKI